MMENVPLHLLAAVINRVRHLIGKERQHCGHEKDADQARAQESQQDAIEDARPLFATHLGFEFRRPFLGIIILEQCDLFLHVPHFIPGSIKHIPASGHQ
jgi:hypothetical protein